MTPYGNDSIRQRLNTATTQGREIAIMRRFWLLAFVGFCGLASAGCNSASDDGSQTDGTSAATNAGESQVKSDGRTPKEIVETLMQAMLSHDQAKVDSMLTAKARLANVLKAETPQDQKIRYKVGDVEMIGEGNAHVAAAWFHPNEDGSEYRVMTMWMLRNDPEGYRVYGNIMIVPQLANYDGGKVAFDFEDAEQFAATENRVHALLEKIAAEASGEAVAENPGTTSTELR
jgi:hypothetical protein